MEEQTTHKYLTPSEIADMLKVHVTTIYRYIDQEVNPLPAYKITKNVYRIEEGVFNDWLKTQGTI